MPAPARRPDLRDDEAPAADPRASRSLGRATDRTDSPNRRLSPKGNQATDTRLKRRLEAAFADQLTDSVRQRGDTTEIWIGARDVTDVMRRLHDDAEFGFELLADIAGVDTGSEMWVVYHLYSTLTPDWLRVVAAGLSRDDPRVPSITFLWKGAEWGEREAYDMFGIIFEGNRDLRRIYMPADYVSFPLRKDFLLPDDAARSPGEGFRHMEQTHQPAETRRQPVLRQSKLNAGTQMSATQLSDAGEAPQS